jgi:hypothetical protein
VTSHPLSSLGTHLAGESLAFGDALPLAACNATCAAVPQHNSRQAETNRAGCLVLGPPEPRHPPRQLGFESLAGSPDGRRMLIDRAPDTVKSAPTYYNMSDPLPSDTVNTAPVAAKSGHLSLPTLVICCRSGWSLVALQACHLFSRRLFTCWPECWSPFGRTAGQLLPLWLGARCLRSWSPAGPKAGHLLLSSSRLWRRASICRQVVPDKYLRASTCVRASTCTSTGAPRCRREIREGLPRSCPRGHGLAILAS